MYCAKRKRKHHHMSEILTERMRKDQNDFNMKIKKERKKKKELKKQRKDKKKKEGRKEK